MIDSVWIYVCDKCDTQSPMSGRCASCEKKMKSIQFFRSPAPAATVTGATWAGALMATRTGKFHIEAECVSVVIAAQDEGKANVTAMNMCHKRWPDSDGWINHSQCVVAIPRLTPPALTVDAVTAVVDDILSDLYKRLIDKSWENSETFEAYQDAWEHVADVFNVGKFDWTRGERPRTHALAAVREGSE